MGRDKNIIGLGTAAIGRPKYINIKQNQTTQKFNYKAFYAQAMKFVNDAYNLGIRYFDTAPGYGMAEKIMLDFVNQNPNFDLNIATKWGYTYTANFQEDAKNHEVKEHSLSKLLEQWETSKGFGSRTKIYQIHSATLDSGVLKNREVLDKLRELKQNNSLEIGLTTSGKNQSEILEQAQRISFDGTPLFTAFQVTYNVLEQSTKKHLLDLQNSGNKIIVKEAMANGRFFIPNSHSKLHEFMTQLSQKYTVGIDAIALRFCIESLLPFKVLSGVDNVLHLTQNLKALTFQLEKEEINALSTFSIPSKNYWNERKQLKWN